MKRKKAWLNANVLEVTMLGMGGALVALAVLIGSIVGFS